MKQKQINQNWKEFEFLDCLKSEASQNSLKINKQKFLEKGEFPIIDQGDNCIAGYTNDKNKVYSKQLPVVVFGDHTRAIKFVDLPFAFGADGIKILVPKEKINAKYFYYALRNLNILSAGYSRHYKFLKEKRISLPILSDGTPDLEKQKQIVAILEKAEGLKDKRKGLDELFDEYLKSVFYEMFLRGKGRFEEVVLEDVCNFIDYRGKTPKKTSSGIPLITAKNVKKGFISKDPQEFISPDDYLDWMTRGFPKKGDVLFTTEAPLGNVAKLGDFDKIALAQRIITLHPSEKIKSDYLFTILLSDLVKARLLKQSTGSTIKGIRSKLFKKIKIPLPSIKLQEKFASIVEQIEKIKDKLKDEKKDADELFGVLMQKAFSGELI